MIPALPTEVAMQCPSCGSACITVSAEEEEKRIEDFQAGRYKWSDYNLRDPEPPGGSRGRILAIAPCSIGAGSKRTATSMWPICKTLIENMPGLQWI